MTEQIKLSMILKSDPKNQISRAQLRQLINDMGMDVTALGRATLSVRLPRMKFDELFDTPIVEQQQTIEINQDHGASHGYHSKLDIPIPDRLKQYITTISMEPPSTRFIDNQAKGVLKK